MANTFACARNAERGDEVKVSLKNLFRRRVKMVRLELRFVRYPEAEILLKEGWRISSEYEDGNTTFGMVWMELCKPESRE